MENGKHGIDWTEGPNTAKLENLPQGQWTLEDLKFAAEKAATLKVGQSDFSALPGESKSVVHLPDGKTVKATRIFVRNDGETFHGHPRND